MDAMDAAPLLFKALDEIEGFAATAYQVGGPRAFVRQPLPQEIWSKASMEGGAIYVTFADDHEQTEMGGHVRIVDEKWFGARVEKSEVLRLWPANGTLKGSTHQQRPEKSPTQVIDDIVKSLDPRSKAQKATYQKLRELISEGLDDDASEDEIVAKLSGHVLKPNKIGAPHLVDPRRIRVAVQAFLVGLHGDRSAN